MLKHVTLEVSLKPFHTLTDDAIAATCRRLFGQWLPLLRCAEAVQVMMWTADGSEILDYRGSLDDTFEWARLIGHANPHGQMPNDPEGVALHSRGYLYRDDAPVYTYGDLARVVAALKRVGHEVTGLPVRVGATFDPGPEFAVSSFKYQRHNEICLAGTMGAGTFVCCYTTLHADQERYAGFPDGIPEGTPLGTFLGRQAKHFMADLGFDYLWLSNGFGYGMETWKVTGPMFDGDRFDPSQAAAIRERTLEFWRTYRAECSGSTLEVRGTNLSIGSDLASDAVPWREINRGGFDVVAPPNSPWAALDGDFGLELMGYLSRIADLPSEGYPFRYYTHDPWWLNSPWLDRYGREPHDIYLPLSVGRVDEHGVTAPPAWMNLLTVDDSYGELPDQVPEEVIPHVKQALRHAADEPGPLVWLYPFDDYHDAVFGPEPHPEWPFFGDWFIRSAINNGFPLNTVVSTRNWLQSLAERPAAYDGKVLVAPVPPAGSDWGAALLGWLCDGGQVLLYGPTDRALPGLRHAVGVSLAAPLSGEFDLCVAPLDSVSEQPLAPRICHREPFCAGGIAEVAEPGVAEVLASVSSAAGERVAAVSRRLDAWHGGALAWVRGTNSNSYRKGAALLTPDNPAEMFSGDLLLRHALAALGLEHSVAKRRASQRNPVLTIARHDNGFFFSGYSPDSTVTQRLRLPAGAPLLVGCETWLERGCATYTMPRAWHRECRVFVEQADGAQVACAEQHSGEIGVIRRLRVTGLQDATVRFYPETAAGRAVKLMPNAGYPFQTGEVLTPEVEDRDGRALVVRQVSGTLWISW